ncbi:MAG: hypothetical protein HRT45_06995 [Bdellovibrionales bacterium]|nr:hypothetical protein [Bdellovibrionales bacterium]
MFFTGRFERYSVLSLLAIFVLSFFLQGCTLRKPKTEKPVPNIQNISKSFFLNSGTEGKFRLQGATSKTFLCGWAPENSSGHLGYQYMHNYNFASHCNLKFRIFKTKLVGYLVNPSRDEDKWEPAISIGISKHYYREKARDENGRDSNRIVEQERSDWEARPFMSLDFSNINILLDKFDAFACHSGGSTTVDGVVEDETEWDLDNGFLGFTLKVSSSCRHHGHHTSNRSGTLRFNFMEFEHDPNFEKTPYSNESAAHFNILHILGTRHNGMNRNGVEMYGAKWDITKKHKVYINRFPEEYKQVGVDAVELWNDMFEDIYKNTGKTVRPFIPVVEDLEHSFDLRKPTMTWVDDLRDYYRAPLGIGMVSSDVRNGKILWGGVTVWGESIRQMVNSYASSASLIANSEAGFPAQSVIMTHRPSTPDAMKTLDEFSKGLYIDPVGLFRETVNYTQSAHEQGSQRTLGQLEQFIEQFGEDDVADLTLDSVDLRYILSNEALMYITEIYPNYQAEVNQLHSNYDFSRQLIEDNNTSHLPFVNNEPLSRSMDRLNEALRGSGTQYTLEDFNSADQTAFLDQVSNEVAGAIEARAAGQAAFDFDRYLGHSASGWAEAVQKGYSVEEVRKAIFKDLLLHEIGHMIGLGHNFKENIIPEKGTVPQHHIDKLASFNNDEKGYIQMTTVMGYRSGYTEAVTPYEHIKPGPHDRLVLYYLYRKKVAEFKFGDTTATDFRFTKNVPSDGKIGEYFEPEDRREGEWYTSYFPACNDSEASFGGDPYCRRHDRGGDAISLVKNRFRQMRGFLDSLMINFADTLGAGSHYRAENFMYHIAMKTFSESRVFYDYMRQKYDDKVILPEIASGPQATNNLLQFSQACRHHEDHPNFQIDDADEMGAEEQAAYEASLTAAQRNPVLKKAFEDYPELQKLCVASGIYMHEVRNVLRMKGKDYSKLNYNNSHKTASIYGGDLNWGDFSSGPNLGTYMTLGLWPIKSAAIYNTYTPHPIFMYYGWFFSYPRFARKDSGYLLSTLYPIESNLAMKSGFVASLDLGGDESDESTKNVMNSTLQTLGWSQIWQYYGNDNKKMSALSDYFTMIRNQTQFTFSINPIIVTKVKESNQPEISKQLKGEIYNTWTRQLEPLDAIYITEDYQGIGPPQRQSFLAPVNDLDIYNKDAAYYFAYRLGYEDQYGDLLKTSSVKSELYKIYKQVLNRCLVRDGNQENGLTQFFNSSNPDFTGIYWPDDTYTNPTAEMRHRDSVATAYGAYYSTSSLVDVRPETCKDSIRGMGLIMSAAGLLNGYWLNTQDYIEQGYR